ncbi:universal stress protein [Microbacterium sp. P07]|uniref:universal stress protein n=1 Tax=Microbacterium sp. P07 TaxID=3366952 RepID=UPI0037456A19
MSDEASLLPDSSATTKVDAPRGAVIVGVAPGVSPRVFVEAARYATLSSVPLAVVHVDVTRFITFEDPDGYVHSTPIEAGADAARAQLAEVESAARQALAGNDVRWSVHQLIGDPAMALAHLAERIDSPLLVVGTRRRGFGESIREFFTGSVAARLAHRQHRPVLVVPLGEPVPDDEEIDWGV